MNNNAENICIRVKQLSVDKLLGSLALIKANWFGSDYMNSFIPFIATLINKKDYDTIDLDIIVNDFPEEFGFKIPRHPMIDILKRCTQVGLIKRHINIFYPNKEKVEELDFSLLEKEIIQKHDKVINEFIAYAQEKYNVDLNKEEAELILISFLDENSITTILKSFDNINYDVSNNNGKYIFCNFVKEIYMGKTETFSYILDIAFGHMIASAVTFEKISGYHGTLKYINIYFDTKFILRLLGVEGREREEAYVDMINELNARKARLYIFEHTYDEIFNILKDCERWIENEKYNAKYASEALRNFVERKWNIQQVRIFIETIEEKLNKYEISIDRIDYFKSDLEEYQMNDEKFEKMLVSQYKQLSSTFDEFDKKYTIERDIRSISAIYKLRRGRRSHRLKEAQSIFITTNTTLAYVSREFSKEENKGDFVIPPCTTDVFIGTIIWLQSTTQKAYESSQKKLIADCLAALKPNDILIKKFYDEIERLKVSGRISEDDYILLRCYGVQNRYLEEKTFGNASSFNDKIAEEILEEVKSEIKAPIEIQLKRERLKRLELEAMNIQNEKQIQKQKDEQQLKDDRKRKRYERYEQRANKKIDKLTNLILPIIGAILGLLTFIQFIPKYKNTYIVLKIVSGLFTFLSTILIPLLKFNYLMVREKLKKCLVTRYAFYDYKKNDNFNNSNEINI